MSMGDVRSWRHSSARSAARSARKKHCRARAFAFSRPTISSPTLADQLRNFLKIYPQAKWHVYEPVNRDNVLEGAKMAFGQPVETRYDLLEGRRHRLARRRLPLRRIPRQRPLHPRLRQPPQSRRGNMNRLYVIESTPTSTGAKADHRYPMQAAMLEVLRAFSPRWLEFGDKNQERGPGHSASHLINDLMAHQGSSL